MPAAKRTAAGTLGWMMLVILLFSAFYIAAETDHDCIGRDCPVCAFIQRCEKTLHGAGGGTAILFSAVLPLLFVLFPAVQFAAEVSAETLVSRKVRLDN